MAERKNVTVITNLKDTEQTESWGSLVKLCSFHPEFNYHSLKGKKFPFNYKGWEFKKVKFNRLNHGKK